MGAPQRLLAVRPVRVWGGGHVVSLPPDVRDVLGAKKGDQIVFRKVGRYVFIEVMRVPETAHLSVDEIEGARGFSEG